MSGPPNVAICPEGVSPFLSGIETLSTESEEEPVNLLRQKRGPPHNDFIPPAKRRKVVVENNDNSEEKEQALLSSLEKAWDIVEELGQYYQGLGDEFQTLWGSESLFEDAFGLVQDLVKTQEVFKAARKSSLVDIGYHFTAEEHLPMIRQQGLLTKAERAARGINAKHHGSKYGDGVYLGNNPFAYKRFGEVGILVARLRGKESKRSDLVWNAQLEDSRTHRKGFSQLSLLRTSAQCVPLVAFPTSLLDLWDDTAIGNAKVFSVHLGLQDVLDKHLYRKVTLVQRVWPSTVAKQTKAPKITLRTVHKEIWLENGAVPMRRLMKTFKMSKQSTKERKDKFRAIVKELCTMSATKGRRVLVLKKHYVTQTLARGGSWSCRRSALDTKDGMDPNTSTKTTILLKGQVVGSTS